MAAHVLRTCIQRCPLASRSASTLLRRTSDHTKTFLPPVATYKSKQALDILYPNSKHDFRTLPCVHQKNPSDDEEFSGVIPLEKLDFKYSKSSGPGGQNVNKVSEEMEFENMETDRHIAFYVLDQDQLHLKIMECANIALFKQEFVYQPDTRWKLYAVNTKVEIRFHVESADWIPNWIKPKLIENEKGRINKDGYMIINSDRTRKQLLNQADCLQKLRTSIFNASYQPREPTEEEQKIQAKRMEKMQRSILKVKREHSLKKQRRQAPTVDSI